MCYSLWHNAPTMLPTAVCLSRTLIDIFSLNSVKMSKHHKIFSPVNQYTSCCFIASVYVDQCHELYEPRYGDSLCYVIPCIMTQKISMDLC